MAGHESNEFAQLLGSPATAATTELGTVQLALLLQKLMYERALIVARSGTAIVFRAPLSWIMRNPLKVVSDGNATSESIMLPAIVMPPIEASAGMATDVRSVFIVKLRAPVMVLTLGREKDVMLCSFIKTLALNTVNVDILATLAFTRSEPL